MEKKELWRNSELYVGLGMIAVFCILLWQIAIISVPESRIFPGFAAAVIGISGLSLVIRACQGKAHGDASKLRIHAKELAAFAILVVACFLFDILGFYTTLLFMLFAISLCVEYPLTGKKIGAYYGCLLLRPGKLMAFDNPENPKIMEDFIRAIGAEPVIYPYRNECCGGYISLKEEDMSREMCRKIEESASGFGADMLITACPLCMYNLNKNNGDNLPVYYFTELLAEALGLKEEVKEQ